ncbi:MAG: 50S ribosomal protein L6 [Verrucomicrobiae bacterium]|nr:50S ribosomal protein L6 [Verrucomicrobiae bacterium]MDW8344557.1 50S ribosomal protein L6 [Verrucomicrobiae bacterium]
MSRIGRKPIEIPPKTKVTVQGAEVLVEGPKGKLKWRVPEPIRVAVEDGKVLVKAERTDRDGKSRWGLSRSLIQNMVTGVNQGYVKKLLIEGVGFRASVQGSNLQMTLGFSHPIVFPIPAGVKVSVADTADKKPEITIEGCDKQLVGEVAARIRKFFPAEPYKGKGVRYVGEQVRRKAGKTVAGGGK